MTSTRAPWLVATLLTFACGGQPVAADAAKNAEAKPEPAAPAEPEKPADPNSLTPEEQRLIDTDPAALTPDERRKRGYALRKKIMQNPDSEAAKALEEARQAALAGEIDVPGELENKPADNGVVIPAPDFLKNQDQSYGKPDQE
jgi:hypothetical protein